MDDAVRVWLVEREYSDEGLLALVYATPDGERYLQSNRSSTMLSRGGVTAAKEVDRVTERYDPGDEV